MLGTRARALEALICLACLVGGCSGTAAADLAKIQEASIVYPGSTLVRTVSQDASIDSGPMFEQVYEVDASQDAVAAYYHDKLVALGWDARSGLDSSGPPSTDYEYQKGNLHIHLTLSAGDSGPSSTNYSFGILKQ
jgi:hypothetical protein